MLFFIYFKYTYTRYDNKSSYFTLVPCQKHNMVSQYTKKHSTPTQYKQQMKILAVCYSMQFNHFLYVRNIKGETQTSDVCPDFLEPRSI